jgi:heat shock protein HslJ
MTYRRWTNGLLAALSVLSVATMACGAASASDQEFPFDSELLYDARPMKGSKQIPSMDIGPRGQASIKLWCNTVTGQFVVVEGTVTILTGPKTERQCPAERMRGDEEMLSALTRVTNWRRDGTVVEFEGPDVARPMRFRLPTN